MRCLELITVISLDWNEVDALLKTLQYSHTAKRTLKTWYLASYGCLCLKPGSLPWRYWFCADVQNWYCKINCVQKCTFDVDQWWAPTSMLSEPDINSTWSGASLMPSNRELFWAFLWNEFRQKLTTKHWVKIQYKLPLLVTFSFVLHVYLESILDD